MALKPENPVVGGTILRRAAIQSPNFVHNVSGWAINQDGTVEFNSGTFRGFIVGGSLFIYSGTPGAGNPPVAYATTPTATTDPFGNTLPATGGGFVAVQGAVVVQMFNGFVQFANSSSPYAAPPNLAGGGSGSLGAQLALVSGKGSTATVQATLLMEDDQFAGTPGKALVVVGNGPLQVAPGDGNTYDTERLTLRLASPVSIGTLATTVFSKHLGVGTYEIEIWAVMNNAIAADTASMSFAASGGLVAAGLVDFEAVTNGVSPIYNASATFTAATSGQAVTANQRILVHLTLIVTTAGTLIWQGITAASTVNVNTNSRMRICPIIAS